MKPAIIPAFAFFSIVSHIKAVPAAPGDLILGFRAGGAPGADTNLEVNLGPAAAFYGAASGSSLVLTKLAVQDLIEVYGENWSSRPDLSWGVIGTTGLSTSTGAPARTIWASAPEAVAGTASIPWTRASAQGLQNASNAIATMYGSSAQGSLGNFPATANSASTSRVNSSNPGSWTVQEDLVAGQSFRRFTPTVRQTADTFPEAGSDYDGTGYAVLDLWELRPGTGEATLLGGLGLNREGKLVFSTSITRFAPLPELVKLGVPAITRSEAGSITVSLENVPAGSYILERSTELAGGGWSALLTQSPAAGTLTFTDNNPPAPRGFYRIRETK